MTDSGWLDVALVLNIAAMLTNIWSCHRSIRFVRRLRRQRLAEIERYERELDRLRAFIDDPLAFAEAERQRPDRHRVH